jgi:hypothetical protein
MIYTVLETVTGRIYVYSKQQDRKEVIRRKGYVWKYLTFMCPCIVRIS